MLDYKDIISKLDINQKIALLTDLSSISSEEYARYGIPRISVSSVWQVLENTGEGITPYTLARTWNPELVERLTQEVLESQSSKNAGFVITPSPKIKLDIYQSALSEDPALAAAFAEAYLKAVHSVGNVGAVDGFFLKNEDLDRMDEDVNRRILYEYFIYPFTRTVASVESCGVVASVTSLDKNYSKLNAELARDAREATFGKKTAVLCEEDSARDTLIAIRNGSIVLQGVANELESAHTNYRNIKASLEKGEAAPFELEEAYDAGLAISDEMIDEAVERVLAFVESCQNDTDTPKEKTEKVDGDTLLEAIRQSVVLLKNEGDILPLKNNPTVAVIGNLAMEPDEDSFASALSIELGDRFLGAVKGYSASAERCEDLVVDAVKLAAKADVVFVALGVNTQTSKRTSHAKTLSLPANQVALLDALKMYRQKLIGVLAGDMPADMRFDRYVEALMLAPLGKTLSAKAITDIAFGRISPSGRLTESYYDDPEGNLEELKYYKKSKRNKVGAFFGYREYDSNGKSIRYPFGYGLSYSEFEYSNLKFKNGKLTLTVKNVGNYQATETVQVYAGKSTSVFVRPKKELKSFIRVELAPKEKKEIEIDDLDLSIYDDRAARRVLEQGEYVIYVGSSVQNIKLEERISIKGEHVKPSKEKRSDYLQSESNIMENKFTVDKAEAGVKKFMFRKIFGIVLLVLAAAAYVLSFVMKDYMIAGIAVGTVLLAVGAFFLISGLVKSSKAKKIDKIRQQQTEARFAEADDVAVDSVDELFVKEFDDTDKGNGRSQKDEDNLEDILNLDNEIGMDTVASQMLTFMREKGIEVSSNETASIIAAFASSRLIFANSDYHGEALNRYFEVLGEYFGAPIFVEEITDRHLPENGLLFVNDYREVDRTTNVMAAIDHACEFRRDIHIIVLNKVNTDQLADLLLPYVRYFNNPMRECKVSVKSTGAEYMLPQNLWFVVDLENGSKLENIPSYLTEIATVLNLSYFERKASDTVSEYQKIGYYEFNHLAGLSKNKFEIGEDVWKKIDGLEAYAAKHAGYHIGNKLALQIEKYFSVYNDCSGEDGKSLDNVFAAKLLPTLMSVLKDKVADDEKSLFETLEQLFGEEMTASCLEKLKGIPSQSI